MDKPVLCDPAIFPTDEVIASHLKKAMPSFVLLSEYNHTNFPEFVERWKYYNDGKSWLMNVSRKKKTVFWLSVKDGSFRTTFYLNARAAQLVPGSDIPPKLKDQFRESEGRSSGRSRLRSRRRRRSRPTGRCWRSKWRCSDSEAPPPGMRTRGSS